MNLKGNYQFNIGHNEPDKDTNSLKFVVEGKEPNIKKIEILNEIVLIISKFKSIEDFDNVVSDAKEIFKVLCPIEK